MTEELRILATKHSQWIDMVNRFGGRDIAEDIVQEAYIRIYKRAKPDKIVKNGKPNEGYMFVVLRNIYIDYRKYKAKMHTVQINDCYDISQDEQQLIDKKGQSKFDKLILDEQEDWHWYDKMLFNYYKESGKSLRDISNETGISVTSIFNTILNCKKRLRKSLYEDYQDYKNKEYERL